MTYDGDATPDLSREFNPVPKPNKKGKKGPKPLKSGKKTEAWEAERAELKKLFEQNGITKCELNYKGCLHDNFLTFAHADKRRFLTVEDLSIVILACQFCHSIIEQKPRVEMGKIVTETIARREGV